MENIDTTTPTEIIDCHSHIIVDKFLPASIYFERYELPKGLIDELVDAYKYGKPLVHLIDKVAKVLGKRLDLERFMDAFILNFTESVNHYKEIQKQNNISHSILLMLDLEYAGGSAPKPAITYLNQIELFSRLAKISDNTLLPFFMLDPRRENVYNLMVDALEHKGFLGIKMYPPLGYSPNFMDNEVNTDAVNLTLHKVYEYCEYNSIPITVHCSPNGIRGLLSTELTHKITHPMSYYDLLYAFPNLFINFAHFGSNSHFMRYFNHKDTSSWALPIYRYMQEFENVYSDMAFHNGIIDDTDSYFSALFTALDDPFVATKLLYGLDSILHYAEYPVNHAITTFRSRISNDLLSNVFLSNSNRFLFNSDTSTIPDRILTIA